MKSVDEIIPETYHEIFVPFPDVYHMAGSDVFTNLERKVSTEAQGERNLIVLPVGYSDRLGRLAEEEQSAGSSEALRYINSAKENNSDDNDVYKKTFMITDSRITIYRTSAGLDVSLIDDQRFSTEYFDMNALRDLVSKFTIPTNLDKVALKLMTNKESDQLKYDSRGFVVEEPQFLQVNEDIVNQGIISGTPELQATLNESKDHNIPLELAKDLLSGKKEKRELYMNQFIRFQGKQQQFALVIAELVKNKSGTRIVSQKNKRVSLLPVHDYDMKIRIGNSVLDDVVGISPRDMEQKITMQYGIFNPSVSLLFIAGPRGTGKTILDFSGIDQVLVYDKDEAIKRGWYVNDRTGLYKKVIMIKAPEILGGGRRAMGFLPGTEFQKMKPHLQPYIDAHEESIFEELGIPFEDFIKHPKYPGDYGQRSEATNNKKIGMAHLPAHSPLMEVRSSAFIGGASLGRTLMFVDEAEDLTPYEMKTIIERMGVGSKLIISGDPAQTRNPYCSRKYNGFTFAIKNYLPKSYSMLIKLNTNYRHQMSEDAEEMHVQNPI